MDNINSSREDSAIGFWRQQVSAGVAAVVLTVMALNLFDAFSTLYLISFGGDELNPLMRKFLTQGPFNFLVVKYFLGAAGMMGITIFYRQTRWARYALFAMLMVYSSVVAYQVYMLRLHG